MRKLVSVIAIGALASLGLAACGGGGGSSSTASTASTSSTTSTTGGPSETVKVSANPNPAVLKYQQSSLSAKAGNVTFDYTNPSSTTHNFCLETGTGGATPSGSPLGCSGTINNGASDSLSVSLKPGKYTYFCNVDSHRAAGMFGTLTVK